MEREVVTIAPDEFFISNRGRLERAWAAFLYIFIEAWQASEKTEVRKYIEGKVSLNKLERALEDASKSGLIEKLREVRHYMCHRDRRQYWDKGRYIHIGNLATMMKLNNEFGAIFLQIMRP